MICYIKTPVVISSMFLDIRAGADSRTVAAPDERRMKPRQRVHGCCCCMMVKVEVNVKEAFGAFVLAAVGAHDHDDAKRFD